MCRSMADIQYATAEIRQGKKDRRRNHRAAIKTAKEIWTDMFKEDSPEEITGQNNTSQEQWQTLIRTISAASTATSVPVPIAMPMLAWARAGESLTPSPTMATMWPRLCSSFTLLTFSNGRVSANTVDMPTCWTPQINRYQSHCCFFSHSLLITLMSR